MQVTAQLWQLAVVHAELPAHLMALKNYFLLAKGDFYHSFLAEVSTHISCVLYIWDWTTASWWRSVHTSYVYCILWDAQLGRGQDRHVVYFVHSG